MSELSVGYVYIQFRLLERGPEHRIDYCGSDTRFLVCCTDFIKKMLMGYLRISMIQVDGDKYRYL